MTNKIRHHYVPAGLSKNFCLEEKRLYVYDVEKEAIYPSSPKDIFVKKKLHSIVTDDGSTNHNLIEDEFMRLEGIGLGAVKKILNGERISSEICDALAVLVSLQQLRTPVYRRGIETMLKEQLRATSRVMDAQGLFDDLPDELKKFGNNLSELLDNGFLKYEIALPQVTMQGLTGLDTLHELLCKMNWCVLESHNDNYFLLSDHPCAILDLDLFYHRMGVGFSHPNIEVTLPVGKNLCVLASWRDVPPYFRVNKTQVSNINRRSAVFGERLFVYPVNTKKIMGLLRPYKSCNFESVALSVPSVGNGQMVVAQNSITHEKLYSAIKPIF